MKELLIVGGAVTGVAFPCSTYASSRGGLSFERLLERMPEDAPPKWTFRNISALGRNTERILQLLESEPSPLRRSRTEALPDRGRANGSEGISLHDAICVDPLSDLRPTVRPHEAP